MRDTKVTVLDGFLLSFEGLGFELLGLLWVRLFERSSESGKPEGFMTELKANFRFSSFFCRLEDFKVSR